ncbi:MAG: YbaN family protein [Pseudomonadota bacterium]
MRIFWIGLGSLSVALGAVGMVLPLLPTEPFLLLAAFAFARSSPRLHDWLIAHPRFGQPILDWRARGAISVRVKWIATGTMAAALGMSLLVGVNPIIIMIQGLVMICVALFIWTRPA